MFSNSDGTSHSTQPAPGGTSTGNFAEPHSTNSSSQPSLQMPGSSRSSNLLSTQALADAADAATSNSSSSKAANLASNDPIIAQPLQTRIRLQPALNTPPKPAARANKAAGNGRMQHRNRDRDSLGHLQGLGPPSLAVPPLLKPTVSSKIKVKGAEGYQLTDKAPAQREVQQKPSPTRRDMPGHQQRMQQQLPPPQQQQQQQQQQQAIHRYQAVKPSIAVPPFSSSGGAPDAVLRLGSPHAASGPDVAASNQQSTLQAAKLQLGLTAGLGVAEELLRTYSHYLQDASAPAISSSGSGGMQGTMPAAAAAAVAPAPAGVPGLYGATAGLGAATGQHTPFFEQYTSTLRQNPLFSGLSHSGDQEVFSRRSLNGIYSTLLSPTRPQAKAAAAASAAADSAAGELLFDSLPSAAHDGSSSTDGSSSGNGSATHAAQQQSPCQAVQPPQGGLQGSTPLNLDDFSGVLSNPIFRGRAVLDWISRHSSYGSAANSGAGGPADATVATTTAAERKHPAAAVAAGHQQQAADTVQGASIAHSTGLRQGHGTSSSSLPSNLSHSLASTGFSTDSEALGQFVQEQVATDNFVITTETAPSTAHFQGRHLKAAAAAAAARAAAARARAGGADAAGVAAAAQAAAAAAAASGASQPAIAEEEEDYDIIFSGDGQVVEYDAATEAAIQAALEQRQQEQQRQQRGLHSTERLPGEFIYEMLPGVGDVAYWATTQLSQHQTTGGPPHDFGDTSSSSSGIYSSSAFASTLSGSDGSAAASAAARDGLTASTPGSSRGDEAASGGRLESTGGTRAWLYGTGGFLSGLKGTFGFMGTIGSLRSTAGGSSLWSTAALGSEGPGNASTSGQKLNQMVEEMAKAQHLLHQNGLMDLYLARSASTMVGTQALMMAALQSAGGKTAQTDSSKGGWSLSVNTSTEGQQPVLPPAPQLKDPKQLKKAISSRMQRQVWAPDKKAPALELTWSPFGIFTCLLYLGATVYYFYVRFAFTMALGRTSWYSAVIATCELVGCSAVVPYCLMLLRRCRYRYRGTGSGLPADDGRWKLPEEKRFKLRVLVPCYKEPLSTIQASVGAAITAELPPGCCRVVYLCDDGKDPAKEAYVKSLGPDAVYVSGRVRAPGEINGKSGNLNNCLQNVIYASMLSPNSVAGAAGAAASTAAAKATPGGACEASEPLAPAAQASAAASGEKEASGRVAKQAAGTGAAIPLQEVVVVFDADMVCKSHFFRHVLEVMWEDDVALCLTPQAFSNIHPAADIFNNINVQFFQYVLPGCDALGYTACTGTNFCVRAQALAKVGWFPTYTITEDYALSMELKKAGCKGRYLPLNLVEGEAPEEVGAVLQQRSRWAKGHMQVFFSSRCPLIQRDLPLLQKILYTNGTWVYFCTILTSFIYTCVPMVSLVWGVHPVTLSGHFSLAATLYFVAGGLVNFSVRRVGHSQGMFLSLVSNYLLAFCYFKAVINTWLSLIGLKRKAGFKATDKKGVVATAGQALRAAVAAVSQFSVTVSQSLASTFRTAADTIHPSSSGAKTATHGSRSTDSASVFGSSLVSSSKSSAMSGRWHAWRGPSHTGDASQARTLNPIDESAAGSTASSSYVGGSSYNIPSATPSISDFSLSQVSCGTDSSGIAGTRAGSSSNSSVAEGPSSAGSAAASQNSGPRASSRLRHATTSTSVQPVAATAASLPLRPSSAEARQPRSGAGLPLGEGLEAESEQHVGAEVPPALAQHSHLASPAAVQVAQAPKPTTVAAAVPATAKSKKSATASTDASDVLLDSSLMKARGTTGCCSCDWLKANVQSMGWKLDPWVILLSLATTLAALAAGAVQLAVRKRSQEQQNALQQVLSGGTIDEFAVLAMLMAGINAIPPLLFIVYLFTKGRLLHAAVWLGQLLNAALFIGAVVALWLLTPSTHDLTGALQLSSTFLQAQRAIGPEAVAGYTGSLPTYSLLNLKDVRLTDTALERYPWLKEGPTDSAADPVQGGFFMGGDYLKQSFPLATNLAMLAWGLLHFKDAYQQAGVLSELRGSLLVGAQYLMDCHQGPGQFVAQIGNPSDYAVNPAAGFWGTGFWGTGFWGLPADMPTNRSVLVVNSTQPGARGAEVLAAASAALSAASSALLADKTFYGSDLLVRLAQGSALSKAEALYHEAQAMLPEPNKPLAELGLLSSSPSGSASDAADLVGVQLFGSRSVLDDMAFAAAWLAAASGNASLLEESSTYLMLHWQQEAAWEEPSYYWPSHDNMAWPAAILLLGQLQKHPDSPAAALINQHHTALSSMLRGWMAGQNKFEEVVSRTPGGFPWAASGAPMPTAAAAGTLGLLWAAEDAAAGAAGGSSVGQKRLSGPVRARLHCWGLQLAEHILGSGRVKPLSYLIGYGSSFPSKPQHRLASCFGAPGSKCSVTTGLMSQRPNPVQLTGALVSGPAQDGTYDDDRTLSTQSSVGIHHNVPLIGLLGGLLSVGVTPGQCAAGHGLFQLYTVKDLP